MVIVALECERTRSVGEAILYVKSMCESNQIFSAARMSEYEVVDRPTTDVIFEQHTSYCLARWQASGA